MPEGFDAGDTAFVLTSAALVMLMTPGLAFFYGGMVRAKSVVNMLLMSFVSLGIVSVLWVAYGYSLAFGEDVGGRGLIGDLSNVGLSGISDTTLTGSVPVLAFAVFQMMFAVITPALISGAIADRTKFGAWMLFVALWVTVVYFPVAHWVWQSGGWIFKLGVKDFAGGTAVHINAGMAALGALLVLGNRVGFRRESMRAHSLPLVMLGSGLLWFGWFGFNAGSALAANGTASVAFMNTQVAAGAGMIGWLVWERVRKGGFTSLGAASGAVAGLVAITPACAVVNIWGAIAIGVIAGVGCAWAVSLKDRFGYDDSLDVVAVHAVGGVVGTLLIGVFDVTDGLVAGAGAGQLLKQAIGAFAVAAYSLALTWLLVKTIDVTIGFRVTRSDEVTRVDQVLHTENAYDFATREADADPVGTIGIWSHSPTARHQSVGGANGPSAH
ncbi:ammonium transporter [Micromonospora ureilytica]|uniref:Ammonium transporter n=1 Tax=Micromonospora ureilytica TaxID=709868 RepID=A0ABS0JBR3_9ACTN|nr:ammonium transporter [Micromonospora ureilytica]MBG6064503.1 Amt family ammonium transporter [Micromonospora ureilytica]